MLCIVPEGRLRPMHDKESESEFDIKTAVATRNAQSCFESAGFSVTEKFIYRLMTTDW